MENAIIRFYPVDNGDTTMIKLSDKTTLLFDIKIRNDERNTDGYWIYDVKSDLLKEIEKKNDIPILGLFVLTHPDLDHCQGFENNFHMGDLNEYSDCEKEMIVIDELWVTPLIFSNTLANDDAKSIRTEAKRRKKLYDDHSPSKNQLGNRLRIIGYDGNENLESVPHYIPGESINEIAGSIYDNFSVFIHAPLKSELIRGKANKDRNATSIITQLRFKTNKFDSHFNTRLILGGDADHYIWERVIEESEIHGNKDALKWDLFLAPHHCSWTYFNDVPYNEKEENKIPRDYSIKLISEYRIGSGHIIASSKLIKDNEDNPPHFPAKLEYIKNISDADDFISLAETPKPSEPLPVTYEVTIQGPVNKSGRTRFKEKKKAAAIIAGTSASTGNWCKK